MEKCARVVMVILIGLGLVYFKGEDQINDYEMTVTPKVYEHLSKARIEREENVNPHKGDVVNPNPRILNSNSVNIIIDKYHIQFEDLQAKATRQMDNLLHQAVKEYHSSKGKGKDIAYFELYKKYSLAAKSLEKSIDASFHSIHQSLVSELEASGYGTSYATYVKQEYEELKMNKKRDLNKKVTDSL